MTDRSVTRGVVGGRDGHFWEQNGQKNVLDKNVSLKNLNYQDKNKFDK
jgi:hypothetical protein